ncbi:MAG: hypothetical protein EHM79_15390 [Geobacter sp.]|nr:MAG: hypothetical protein EHM79_15390 [Geobacter sp.]
MAKASEISADIRSEYNKLIASLKAKQEATLRKIKELQKSGGKAPGKTQKLAWIAIGEAIDSARSRRRANRSRATDHLYSRYLR